MKLSPVDMKRSRLAERLAATFGPGKQMLPLSVVRTEDETAQTWRITLARVDRADGNAHLAGAAASPEYVSQLFQYDAGVQAGAALVPPRRGNPVLGAGPPADTEPIWMELAWGMSTASPHRLLANWPVQGASFCVHGSYVEVFGGVAVFVVGGNPAGSFPVLEASIVPDSGGYFSEDCDLGISQRGVMADFSGVAPNAVQGKGFYVPDFARRVRVVLVDSSGDARFAGQTNGGELRVALTGGAAAQLVWYDDRGRVVWAEIQVNSNTAPDRGVFGYQWHKVPSRAVMLGVYSDGLSQTALVDWGISP